ncbi:hypothetical protein VM636_16370 [Streptomyces sp. SCSIO 75703]|uniref:hypothetical protein n=1 Tax=unclassified Streptomyces TaxID=2593676 RepID=UPI000AAF30E9|nr:MULTISPECIES: hypothetical protein [unclassified Streptomyces]
MAQQDGTEIRRDTPEHHTSTAERGSFCRARCTCGWQGPARRARSQARTDARTHAPG